MELATSQRSLKKIYGQSFERKNLQNMRETNLSSRRMKNYSWTEKYYPGIKSHAGRSYIIDLFHAWVKEGVHALVLKAHPPVRRKENAIYVTPARKGFYAYNAALLSREFFTSDDAMVENFNKSSKKA